MTWFKKLFAAFGIAVLVLCNFILGFYACLHLKRSTSTEIRRQYLRPVGDAPPAVRSGVLVALKAFQDGYIKRDPKELDAFMTRLLSKDGDVLLLGTDSDEWARGYPAVAALIRNDWLTRGQLKFAVDDSIISSSGDVAWVTSVGEVVELSSSRPIRFSAILKREGNKWLFREMHFQWDDRDPTTADLLHTSTHLEIARLVLKKAQNIAQSAVSVFAVEQPLPSPGRSVHVSDADLSPSRMHALASTGQQD